MFEYEINQGPSWLVSFFAQQFLAAIGPMAVLIAFAKTFQVHSFENAFSYFIAACAGFVLGSGVARVAPRWVPTGKWIWIAPICILIAAFVDELFINSKPPYGSRPFRATVTEFFDPNTVAGYVVMFFTTLPTWSCVCYAIGVSGRIRPNAPIAARL